MRAVAAFVAKSGHSVVDMLAVAIGDVPKAKQSNN
jgi:hypothetical protein